ncbi:DUF2971 domain-containing protein [Candidatus Latescibacterota bacterium]
MNSQIRERAERLFELCEDVIIQINQKIILPNNNLIYHYTDANGLKGIVQSQLLWGSNSQYLNDPTEYEYGLSIAMEKLKKGIDERVSSDTEIYKVLMSILEMKSLYNDESHFVFSMSEEGDLLSQWRGYGDFCKGYSIGINPNEIEILMKGLPTSPQVIDLMGFYLLKVIYKKEEQSEIMEDAVDKILNKLLLWYNDDPKGIHSFQHLIMSLLKVFAYTFKHSTWKEEKEWRILYIKPKRTLSPIAPPYPTKYRVSKNGELISYIEMNFGNDFLRLPIKELIIGPGCADNSKETLEGFLSQNNYSSVNVIKSDIPYR